MSDTHEKVQPQGDLEAWKRSIEIHMGIARREFKIKGGVISKDVTDIPEGFAARVSFSPFSEGKISFTYYLTESQIEAIKEFIYNRTHSVQPQGPDIGEVIDFVRNELQVGSGEA